MSSPDDAAEPPVQDAWPTMDCYGCGPANPDGIGLESYRDGDELVATVDPDGKYTSGAENVAYGGFVASLLDCHSVWTAITFGHDELDVPIEERALEFVTAELDVQFRRPTPLDDPLHLRARVDGDVGRRTTVVSELSVDGEVTATGEVEVAEVTDHYS